MSGGLGPNIQTLANMGHFVNVSVNVSRTVTWSRDTEKRFGFGARTSIYAGTRGGRTLAGHGDEESSFHGSRDEQNVYRPIPCAPGSRMVLTRANLCSRCEWGVRGTHLPCELWLTWAPSTRTVNEISITRVPQKSCILLRFHLNSEKVTHFKPSWYCNSILFLCLVWCPLFFDFYRWLVVQLLG